MEVHERKELRLMGTIIQLWLSAPEEERLLAEAERRLRDYEGRFSANDPHSQLRQIARMAGQAPVAVDEDLFQLIQLGKAHSLAADSHLNIAIGPLIQAWHIGFADAQRPTDGEIQRLKKLIDPRKIHLDPQARTVYLSESGMSIDLGALAKGYFADQIIAYFKESGAEAALIDLGGNVLVFGPAPTHEDGYWRIGIQNPLLPRGNFVAVVKVRDRSVVTSGIYERKLEIDGETYHHIFDRQTGYPIQTDLASLTVITERSVDAEIWTTRLFGKTPTEIIQASEAQELISLVITQDQRMAASSAFQQVL